MSEEPVILPFEDRNLRGEYRKYFSQKRKNYQVLLAGSPRAMGLFSPGRRNLDAGTVQHPGAFPLL
jgi:hypothetical protein